MMRRFPVLIWLTTVLVACGSDSTGPTGPDEPAVGSVMVSPSEVTLLPGETEQLTATVFDASGAELMDRTVNWSSGDDAVATVSATGLVTGVDPGDSVTITATSEGQAGHTSVSVVPPPTPWVVTPENLGPGTATAGIRGVDSFASLNVFCDATADFRWGLVVRDVGNVPFTTGVEFTLLPVETGDPSPTWRYLADPGSLFVDAETASELQALIRARDTAILEYPAGDPVVAVTVEFDLRAAQPALEEIEGLCLGS